MNRIRKVKLHWYRNHSVNYLKLKRYQMASFGCSIKSETHLSIGNSKYKFQSVSFTSFKEVISVFVTTNCSSEVYKIMHTSGPGINIPLFIYMPHYIHYATQHKLEIGKLPLSMTLSFCLCVFSIRKITPKAVDKFQWSFLGRWKVMCN